MQSRATERTEGSEREYASVSEVRGGDGAAAFAKFQPKIPPASCF